MKDSRNQFEASGFGQVAPWVDLVNSEEWDGFGNRTDHLADPQWLLTFLKRWELFPFTAGPAPRQKLERLRTLLRDATEKLTNGKSLGHAELTRVNEALKVPVWQRVVQRQNGFRAESVPLKSDWSWALARIAASFGEMLVNQDMARIKICANADCSWIFRDPTKGRTKRWCNDRTCGNRLRVRRARAAREKKS